MSGFIFHFPKPIYYTRHAKARMRWRGVSRDEVKMTLAAPQRKENLGKNRFHYFRAIGEKLIRVTLVEEKRKIIIISVVDKK